MVSSETKHDTSLRILEILKLMLRDDISKHKMIDFLKADEKVGSVFTQEAFIKYFNTMEAAGFNIEKIKSDYSLKNTLFSITLNDEEMNFFKLIIKNYKSIYNNEEQKLFKNLIIRINKYIENKLPQEYLDEIFAVSEEKNNNVRENIIATLRQMIIEEFPIIIKYKKSKNIEAEILINPNELIEKNENIYISGFCPAINRNKKICIDTIVSITQMTNKLRQMNKTESVLFTLYGRLAHSYKLKPAEKLVDHDANSITISNDSEDSDTLMLRLLKYGENCKILKPKKMQEDFLALTDEILKNLQEA